MAMIRLDNNMPYLAIVMSL